MIGDDADLRAESLDHTLPLARSEGRRVLDVEADLDASGGLVRMLAAGSTGRAEQDLELATWDPYGSSNDQVVIHCPLESVTATVTPAAAGALEMGVFGKQIAPAQRAFRVRAER